VTSSFVENPDTKKDDLCEKTRPVRERAFKKRERTKQRREREILKRRRGGALKRGKGGSRRRRGVIKGLATLTIGKGGEEGENPNHVQKKFLRKGKMIVCLQAL